MSAVIAGIGESRFERRTSTSAWRQIDDAIGEALADAGLAPGEVEGVFTDAVVTPPVLRPEMLMGRHGMDAVQRVSEASRGGLYAVIEAADMIAAGAIGNALVYLATNWGSVPAGPYGAHDRFAAKAFLERPYGFYGQPVYYSGMATRYAHDHGLTLEELQEVLADYVVSTRANGAANERAQLRRPLDRAEYFASPVVAYPLRRDDCSLITDGAVAVVLVDGARGRSSPRPPVSLLGVGLGEQAVAGDGFFTQGGAYPRFPAAEASSRRAYAMAGIEPADVDVFEIYDCFSISALLQMEDMGLCGRGEVAAFVAGGRTRYDGATPVNTHGGLISHGHLVGMNHLTEAVRQLRGDAGRAQVRDADLAVVAMPPNRYHTTAVLAREER